MKKISRRSFVNKFGIGVGASVIATNLPSFLSAAEPEHPSYNGKKINLALCGLGIYANIVAESMQGSEYCNLAGIVTGTPLKAIKWKEKYIKFRYL